MLIKDVEKRKSLNEILNSLYFLKIKIPNYDPNKKAKIEAT
jgi:hypothetical protein